MAGLDSYVKLLLHMDGTDGSQVFTDSSGEGKTPSLVGGNAQIDTAIKQFGTGSGLFAGPDTNTDYLSYGDDSDFDIVISNSDKHTKQSKKNK